MRGNTLERHIIMKIEKDIVSLFPVGTTFKTKGKNPNICKVIDRLTTFNLSGKIVKVSYVATHEFCGQLVTVNDYCRTTIARGLISTPTPAKGDRILTEPYIDQYGFLNATFEDIL